MHRIAPVVRRVIIADPNPAAARLLTDLLKGFGAREVVTEPDDQRVLDLAREIEPGLILIERTGPRLDGEALTKRIRRSSLLCRRAPVIMVTAEATASTIKGARDSGVHEFLRKPFTSGDLFRRIENLATKPRDWIEAVGYVGPDRRRFNASDYAGPQKRKADRESGALSAAGVKDQAMKILASVLSQFDSDPGQALRAVKQQAATLKNLAITTGDAHLAVAAAGLETTLASGPPTKADLMAPIQALLALAEPETLARAG
jgi:CheY-like chemotaxis protein